MATVSAYYATGETVKAVVRNSSLQFADVVAEAMESYNDTDLDDYDTACTEIGSTGEYYATWPTWLVAGLYTIQFIPLAGGSIVESDFLNRFASQSYYWDGTNLVPDWAAKLAGVASPVADSVEERLQTLDADNASGGRTDLILNAIPTTTEFELRTKLTAEYADKTTLDIIAADVAGLDGAAMRGTDSAYTGTPLTANEIADAYLDRTNGVETGVTPRQQMQRVGAFATGKISGAGTGTEIFVGMDGLTARITFTVDSSGNRTAVTYDA